MRGGSSCLRTNGGTVYFGGLGDSNQLLQYSSDVDGPLLQGRTGGKLGTASKTNVLSWNGAGVTTPGNLIVSGKSGTVTSKLQCSTNGSSLAGIQTGSFQATTNATQTATFPNSFLSGNARLVFLQVVYGEAFSHFSCLQ
jgi:hypothetical protein